MATLHYPVNKQQESTNAYQAPVFVAIDDKGDAAENDYNFDFGPDENGFEMHIHSVVRYKLLDPPDTN